MQQENKAYFTKTKNPDYDQIYDYNLVFPFTPEYCKAFFIVSDEMQLINECTIEHVINKENNTLTIISMYADSKEGNKEAVEVMTDFCKRMDRLAQIKPWYIDYFEKCYK